MERTSTIQILDLRCTTTEQKSPITRFLETKQYIIVTLHVRYNFNFNMNLIISDIYGMALIRINILPFYSKTNQMHNISNLFYFGTILYLFRTVFPSIIRSFRLYNHIPDAVCIV